MKQLILLSDELR